VHGNHSAQDAQSRVHRRIRSRTPLALALLFVVASLAGPLAGGAQATTFEFPSSSSAVVSDGGAPAGQVGYFWTKERGDKVSQSFAGPPSVNHVALTLQPSVNTIQPGIELDWTLSINGVDVGAFVLHPGETAPIVFDRVFAPLTGPSYTVEIRVTNVVPSGGGAVSFPTSGNTGSHSLQLDDAGTPNTLLTSGPDAVTASTSAAFIFGSPQTNVTGFQCSLDHASFVPCLSPRSYGAIAPGPHSFEVSAVNVAGTDPSPATWQWTVTASGVTPQPTKPITSHKCKKGFKRANRHGKSVCVKKKHHKPKHRHH
jgi:hypothetical protein